MAVVEELITEHIDVWTSAVKRKSSAGRGGGKKIQLYGVKKLRELILDLAVRGLLVPQDAGDEPAIELIKKAATERVAQIKTGEVKKQKPLTSITNSETPNNLPEHWAVERFGNLAIVERGGSPRPIKSYITESPDGLNWIKIGDTDIGGKYINSTNEKITKDGLHKTRLVYPGDFLLTNSMSFGRPYITNIEGCIHDGWLRISPFKFMDKDFLYQLLSSPYIVRHFKDSASGAVVQNLNSEKVREVPILLPPFNEQRRIAAKVDELMALCDQLEQQSEASLAAHQTLVQTLLDALTQAASQPNASSPATAQPAANAPTPFEQAWHRIAQHFDTLFTTEHSIDLLKQNILQLAVMGKLVPQDPLDEPASELLKRIAAEKAELVAAKKIKKQKALPEIAEDEKPFGLPVGWEWSRINEILVGDTQNGISKKANEKPEGVPLLRISAATTQSNFLIDVTDFKLTTDVTKEQIEKYSLQPKDLLAVRFNGNKSFVGRTAIFDCEDKKTYVYPDKLIRMRLSVELSNSYLLRYFMNSPAVRVLMEHHCATTVGNWGISAKNLKTVPIPFPPIAEQHRIVAKVDELMALSDQLKARLADAQNTQLQLTDAVTDQAVSTMTPSI